MNTVKFKIISTTDYPHIRISDIKEWLNADVDTFLINGDEADIDEVMASYRPINNKYKAECVFVGFAKLGDMLGFVAQLPQGCVKEAKGYNINANNIEHENFMIEINLDFASKLRRSELEITALTLGDEAAQSNSDKSYASYDGAW